jgi:hypothetical protein
MAQPRSSTPRATSANVPRRSDDSPMRRRGCCCRPRRRGRQQTGTMELQGTFAARFCKQC